LVFNPSIDTVSNLTSNLITNMKFVQDPAEQTTAITDIFLAAVAFGGILYLGWLPPAHSDIWKINIWSAAIGLMGLASALGATAHGLVISKAVHNRCWQLLNLSLALTVSLFVVGVVYDLWGLAICFKVLPVMLLAGMVFFVITLLYPGIFFIFIVYEGLALIFALGAYFYLALRGEMAGAGFMAAGILVSILAAGIQAKTSLSLNMIWHFDHNGIYHIVQIAGLVLLLTGLRMSMQ
jgi:hypothetical protein